MPEGKTVVLGVTGCIAAYKAPDIISILKKKGIDVHVIMTRNAQQLVTARTFEAISQNPVTTDLFERDRPWEVEHVALAKKADVLLIAPCTANTIGKIACGIADDILTTTVMATRAPVVIAPAMNTMMYENPVVRDNIKKLKALGYYFVGPISGRLACGDTGMGHIADTGDIVDMVTGILSVRKDMKGQKVLVTAGPTAEPIDPVRYITNRSSGKMGYAVAEAAKERGADVVLVSGPVHIEPPMGVTLIKVSTAEEMRAEVLKHYDKSNIVVKAAAVADFAPEYRSENKLKKAEMELQIKLVKTPDILKELGERKKRQFLIGFAAETENLEEYARAKLEEKNLDMVVANDVTMPGAGFDTETNLVTIFTKYGDRITLPMDHKKQIAHSILDKALDMINE